MITIEKVKDFCSQEGATIEELKQLLDNSVESVEDYKKGDFNDEVKRLRAEGKLDDKSNIAK